MPVVRTFAPITAGVAHMHYRRYSLFNAIGAVVWGFGITMAGFGIGHIPPVAHVRQHYIDLILLGAVRPPSSRSCIQYFHGVHEAKKADVLGRRGRRLSAGDAPRSARAAVVASRPRPPDARRLSPASAATRGAMARNALRAVARRRSSRAAVSSAALRVPPSGRKIGS